MAYVSNPYLTGTRVYNGGTNNSTGGTTGQMDQADIARRELSRGLNLSNRVATNQATYNQPQPPTGGQNSQIYWYNQPQAQQTSTPSPEQTPAQNTNNYQLPLFINRTPTDTLLPPNVAAIDPKLPMDLSYSNDLASNYENYSALAAQLLQQGNQTEQQYTTNQRNLEKQIGQIDPRTLAEMANRGLGYSSIYTDVLGNRYGEAGNAITQLNEDYTNALATNTQGLKEAGTRYTRANLTAAEQLAERLAAKAGTGLGITPDIKDVTDPGSALNTYIQEQIRQATRPSQKAPPPLTTTPPKPPVKVPPITKTPTAPKLSVPAQPSGMFRSGSKGSSVSSIQTMLNKYGAKLKVDGSFGNATSAAVKAFQKAHGLVADGVVGPKTLAALWK